MNRTHFTPPFNLREASARRSSRPGQPFLRALSGLAVFSLAALASAQEPRPPEKFHWGGLYLNGVVQTKLPHLARLGATYGGGTAPGAVHTVMVSFGQTGSPTQELNIGYFIGVGVGKENMSTIEDKQLGIHATFEAGPFRASATTSLQLYKLIGAVLPMFTTTLRPQGTLVRTAHVDLFLGGDVYSLNLDFQIGITCGLRFRDIRIFDRSMDGLLSISEMNAWTSVPTHGTIWAAYVESRLGIVVDLESDKEEKRDRVREYGQL
ncbi:hypothetical protein WMF11_08675 [Sorangium sp. So ce295]|jgi:hypothetical protein|uniref:hypothetical protein n=1 Tax=Sorangium sp. So ce295 TaxID=3133295 RepID=UPI003F6073D2